MTMVFHFPSALFPRCAMFQKWIFLLQTEQSGLQVTKTYHSCSRYYIPELRYYSCSPGNASCSIYVIFSSEHPAFVFSFFFLNLTEHILLNFYFKCSYILNKVYTNSWANSLEKPHVNNLYVYNTIYNLQKQFLFFPRQHSSKRQYTTIQVSPVLVTELLSGPSEHPKAPAVPALPSPYQIHIVFSCGTNLGESSSTQLCMGRLN